MSEHMFSFRAIVPASLLGHLIATAHGCETDVQLIKDLAPGEAKPRGSLQGAILFFLGGKAPQSTAEVNKHMKALGFSPNGTYGAIKALIKAKKISKTHNKISLRKGK